MSNIESIKAGNSNVPPTDKEIEDAADVLRRLPPGRLPLSIFLEVTRLVVTPVIELAPIREKDGKIEVLLTKRPDDDPNWPGQWHIPGCVVLSTDDRDSFRSAVGRIMERELHGTVPMVGDPQLAGQVFHDVERGQELDSVFYFKTDAPDEAVAEGQFFDTNNLPENMIEYHRDMIESIVTAYAVDGAFSPELLQAPHYPFQ